MTDATTSEQSPLTFKDDMHKMQFTMLSDMIAKRNDLVGRANAANGDRLTLTEQIRENSTDPEIVAAREAWSQAVLNLDALVKPKVDQIIADSAGSVEAIETEIKEIDATLKPGLNFFKKLYTDGSAEHFPTQDRLKGTVVRSGGGGRRIRGFNVEVTVDGETRDFENFASAAKYLDVDTQDLQDAFFKSAGTETLKDVPDVVKVTVNFEQTDADGNKEEKEALVKAYRTEPTASTTPTETATAVEPEPEVIEDDFSDLGDLSEFEL